VIAYFLTKTDFQVNNRNINTGIEILPEDKKKSVADYIDFLVA